MRRRELNRLILLVSYLLGIQASFRSVFISFGNTISEFWKNSGVINSTKYWAEVYRLTLVYLSNEKTRDLKTWVSISKSGIPRALPKKIRDLVVLLKHGKEDDNIINIIRAFFSILTFFRGISGFHKPKFGSITDPFKGKSNTLDIGLILQSIRNLRIKPLKSFKTPKFFIPSKAGANSSLVLTSIGLDLLAMMDNPSIWLCYVRWCYKYKFHSLLFTFVFFSLLLVLPYIIFKFLQLPLKTLRDSNASWNPILDVLGVKALENLLLGRLSIVKEARQKARVVGITDWWTQMLLKPLHDHLSNILQNIPEDGTFAQSKPVDALLFNPNIIGSLNDPIDSIDLSNATDRLPVKLQADILDAIGIDGKLWMQILDRPYFVPELGQNVKYSVGQPMGAYSSFNMLALTNHVVNQAALILANVKYVPSTGQYAVLGDDVAIKVGSAALIYKSLLDDLGVETNPIKGFSGNVIEFAKRIYFNCFGKVYELSPIGTKALVNAIRDPLYLVSVYLDLNKKSFVYSDMLNRLFKVLGVLYNKNGVSLYLYTFCILGPQGGLWPNPKDSNPEVTPLTVSGDNFSSVKANFEYLVETILGLKLDEISGTYAWELQKLSAKPQSVYSELLKILNEFSLLTWVIPYPRSRMNIYHLYSRYTLAIYSSLLASLISLPILIYITIDRFIAFASVEVLKWRKRNRFGNQIPIPIHLHHLPVLNPFKEGFNISYIIDFFNSGMSSSNMPSYLGDEWLEEFNKFKELNKLDGNDPIRYFMWDYHYSVPFNVIINKVTTVGLLDDLGAMKIAKLCLSDNPHWATQISNNKKAKVMNDRARKQKRRSKNNK